MSESKAMEELMLLYLKEYYKKSAFDLPDFELGTGKAAKLAQLFAGQTSYDGNKYLKEVHEKA